MNGFNYYCIDSTRMNIGFSLLIITAFIIAIIALLLSFSNFNKMSIPICIADFFYFIIMVIIFLNVDHTFTIESNKKIESDIRNHFSENIEITYNKNNENSVQKNGIILSSDCTYEFIVDYDEDKITIYPINENNDKKSIIIYGNK